jgi:hypothetical protein
MYEIQRELAELDQKIAVVQRAKEELDCAEIFLQRRVTELKTALLRSTPVRPVSAPEIDAAVKRAYELTRRMRDG